MSPSSEVWTADLLQLWHAAGVVGQRAALRVRYALRCAETPTNLPRPTDPLLSGIYALEMAYRGRSECRGSTGERL